MTGREDELRPFDADVVTETAAEYGVDEATLTDAVRAHQQSVAELPGVENLVYEWRKQYGAPVVERTERVYYLVVPDWVWGEFGDSLGIGDRILDALVDVHRRTVTARTDAAPSPPDGQAYVALDRKSGGS